MNPGGKGGSPLAGLRILLVEDEMMLAMLMKDWLEQFGCTVAMVAHLQKATTLAESGDFDVGLLDVNLAREDSYPVAEILDRRGIPFIFMSGYSRDMLREDFRERPALEKPFQMAEVQRLLCATVLQEQR